MFWPRRLPTAMRCVGGRGQRDWQSARRASRCQAINRILDKINVSVPSIFALAPTVVRQFKKVSGVRWWIF
jgi:hypothetical protein